MEENINKGNEMMSKENCSCGCGKSCKMGCCSGHKHGMLRWLLMIVVLAIVFCLGVKVGEFKGSFGYGYYGRGMHQYPIQGSYMMGGQGFPTQLPYGMMQFRSINTTTTTTPQNNK